jgi:hypothetical protein
MADTNLSAFSSGCADFVRRCVLDPLSVFLSTKGVSVSADELATVLALPVTKTSPLLPAVPPMAFGGGAPVPQMVASVAPTRGSKKEVLAQAQHIPGTCNYQYKRGDKKGLYCCKPVAAGAEKCSTCSKSGSKRTTSVPTMSAGLGGIPGMMGVAPPVQQEDRSLDVVEFDASRSLYKESHHNFIVQVRDDETVVLVGKLNEQNAFVSEVSEQDKITASSLGITVLPQPVSVPAPAPAPMVIPSIPQGLPTMVPLSGIPNIPTVTVQ